uniref:DM domain-containing protein n=1 Tax=Steinernema glaseri TaxID=37863 RepID=A0A1I8ADH7_9BILA
MPEPVVFSPNQRSTTIASFAVTSSFKNTGLRHATAGARHDNVGYPELKVACATCASDNGRRQTVLRFPQFGFECSRSEIKRSTEQHAWQLKRERVFVCSRILVDAYGFTSLLSLSHHAAYNHVPTRSYDVCPRPVSRAYNAAFVLLIFKDTETENSYCHLMTNHSAEQLKGISEGSPGPAARDAAEKQPQSQSVPMTNPASPKSPSHQKTRVLFCRKCEGHGVQAILKGHAPTCPYNLCNCKSCEKLMSKRLHSFNKRNKSRLEAAAALTATRNRLRAEALANNLDPDEADLHLSNQPHLLRALLSCSPTGDMDENRNSVIEFNQGSIPSTSTSVSPRLDDTRCSSNSNPNEVNAMSYDIWMKLQHNGKKTSTSSSTSDRTANSSPGTRKRSYEYMKSSDDSKSDNGHFSAAKEQITDDDDEYVTLPTIPPIRCKIRRQDGAERKSSWSDGKATSICQPQPVHENSVISAASLTYGQKLTPPPALVTNPIPAPQPLNISNCGVSNAANDSAVPMIRPTVAPHALNSPLLNSFTTAANVMSTVPPPMSSDAMANPLVSAAAAAPVSADQRTVEFLQNEVQMLKSYCQELTKQLQLQNQRSQAHSSLLSVANPLSFSSPNTVLHPIPSTAPPTTQYYDLVQQQLLINSLSLNPKDTLLDAPSGQFGIPQVYGGPSLQSFVSQLSSLGRVMGHESTIM